MIPSDSDGADNVIGAFCFTKDMTMPVLHAKKKVEVAHPKSVLQDIRYQEPTTRTNNRNESANGWLPLQETMEWGDDRQRSKEAWQVEVLPSYIDHLGVDMSLELLSALKILKR